MNIFQKLKAYYKRRMQEIEQEEYDKVQKPKIQAPKVNVWTDAELESFRRNLSQVIAWTAQILEGFDYTQEYYGKILRQTNPVIDGVQLYSYDNESVRWTKLECTPQNHRRLLKIAIDGRPPIAEFDFQNLAHFGRILSFETSNSTYDGAPIVESQFFVDDADVPPIDTWFFLRDTYFHGNRHCNQALFCWIPKEFEAVMQQTIGVEILCSYEWLDENDPEFYARLIVTA